MDVVACRATLFVRRIVQSGAAAEKEVWRALVWHELVVARDRAELLLLLSL